MILTPLEAVVGMGFNFISRRFEWEADRFACELQHRGYGRQTRTCTCHAPCQELVDRLGGLAVSLVLVLVIIDSIFVVQLLGVSPQSPYTDRTVEGIGVVPG